MYLFCGNVVTSIRNSSWILDSGATDHMTGSSQFSSSNIPLAENQKVKIADGSHVAGKGPIVVSSSLAMHVSFLPYNLLFVNKLTTDLDCHVILSSHHEFQD